MRNITAFFTIVTNNFSKLIVEFYKNFYLLAHFAPAISFAVLTSIWVIINSSKEE